MISDYCRGDGEHTMSFRKFIKTRGYQLITLDEYTKMLEKIGFEDIEAKNNNMYFRKVLRSGAKKLKEIKNEMLDEYSEEDYNNVSKNLTDQMDNVDRGDLIWGHFIAKKMFD